MININKIMALIDIALAEAKNYAVVHYHGNQDSISDTKKVLNLLKEEVKNHPENINQRVLRAMHDTGMASYKEYENTVLEEAINNLTELLYKEIPQYKNLHPLGIDFGKGDPI